MSEPIAFDACGRTSAFVTAILDGHDSPADRAHAAACPSCRHAADRVDRFTGSLAAVAAEAGDGIPDPTLLGRRADAGRVGRLGLRMTALTAAIAAGLVLTAIIGSRTGPPTALPDPFGAPASVRGELAILGLVCGQPGDLVVCEAAPQDHVHRVTLTLDGGRIVGIEARIASSDGKALRLSGFDDYFARVATAVLDPGAGASAAAWIREAYAGCGPACSSNLAGVEVALSVGRDAVALQVRVR